MKLLNRNNKTTKTIIVLFVLTFLIMAVSLLLAQDTHKHEAGHEGHDHAAEQKDKPELIKHDDHYHEVEPAGDSNAVIHDEHEGHDHDIDPVEEHSETEHEGHDHDADHGADPVDAGHEGHDHEDVIELSPEAVEMAGISLANATRDRIGRTVELPGEIGFNEDRLAHISPRFAGIALKANYRVGDYVEAGAIVAKVESNESMNSYNIKAPISGWIIDRHITPGEFVSEENSIYLIADLSNVWANLSVYPKDADLIKKGQMVFIKAVGSELYTRGMIEFVTPIMDVRTRSMTARVILPNPENSWRPGTFIQANVIVEAGSEGIVIEKSAIQLLDEKNVVFMPDGPGRFKPVEVVTGDGNSHLIQIISGIDEGSEYVVKGAFELKAKIVTSTLGEHAGHSH